MGKILGLCGSLRAESYNLKLLKLFLSEGENNLGWDTALYPSLDLPLVNEDLEKSPLPSSIVSFRKALEEYSVVALASPEYNGSFSPALKNAIDWGSRPPRNLWEGKVVVLLSASPGSLGGARGLIQLKTVVSGIKSWVIPEQIQLPSADKILEGNWREGFLPKQIQGALDSLKRLEGKLLY